MVCSEEIDYHQYWIDTNRVLKLAAPMKKNTHGQYLEKIDRENVISILDTLIIEPKVFGDDRGCFFESFNEKEFSDAVGRDITFVQDNHSSSKKEYCGAFITKWSKCKESLLG